MFQFTIRASRYRGLKSRPAWSVLERVVYHAMGKRAGFMLAGEDLLEADKKDDDDPGVSYAAGVVKAKAASFRDVEARMGIRKTFLGNIRFNRAKTKNRAENN